MISEDKRGSHSSSSWMNGVEPQLVSFAVLPYFHNLARFFPNGDQLEIGAMPGNVP